MAPSLFHRRAWSTLYWLPSIIFFSTQIKFEIITGRSMQPTLNPDSSLYRDVGLFSRFAVDGFQRDDIVILRSPDDPNKKLIKRIIAKVGDRVQSLPPYPDREITVQEGHVWVEGDERFGSDDSNRFGPVPEGLIETKMLMIVWPPYRFGFLKDRPVDAFKHPRVAASSSEVPC